MNNEASGGQSVLRLYKNLPQQGNPFWLQEESLGEKWNKAEMQVKLKQWERVVFEGTIGSGGDGDVALDDIEMKDC